MTKDQLINVLLLHLKTPDTDLGAQGRFDYVLHMRSDAQAKVPDIVIEVLHL